MEEEEGYGKNSGSPMKVFVRKKRKQHSKRKKRKTAPNRPNMVKPRGGKVGKSQVLHSGQKCLLRLSD